LQEQLAARQLTEGAIPNQVLPVTDVDVENSSQSISGLATSAGNNHILAANLQPAMSEEDIVGALTFHYPIAVQRSLISGNIKTTQDEINLLGKLDVLEDREDYRNPWQNSENRDASRRHQYNSRGDRTDRNQRDSIRLKYVQYADGSNYDRQRAYGSPNRHDRRGHYDSGWGEHEERWRSRRTRNSSLSMNPAAQNFEPRTENT
jgi:hypothetical protein